MGLGQNVNKAVTSLELQCSYHFATIRFNSLWMGKFLKIMSKIPNLFHAWSLRELSLYDKITIAKTLGLCKLVFVSTCIHTLPSVLYRYDHIITVFVRDGKNQWWKEIHLWVQKKEECKICQNLTQYQNRYKLLGFKGWEFPYFYFQNGEGPFIFDYETAVRCQDLDKIYWTSFLHWWSY